MARDVGCPPGSVCPKCGFDLQGATIDVADWCAPGPDWGLPVGTIATQANVLCPGCKILHVCPATCDGSKQQTWFWWRSLLRDYEDQAIESLKVYLQPKEGEDGTDG